MDLCCVKVVVLLPTIHTAVEIAVADSSATVAAKTFSSSYVNMTRKQHWRMTVQNLSVTVGHLPASLPVVTALGVVSA